MSGRKWTEEEIRFLERNWVRMRPEEIAAQLGRSVYGVRAKGRLWGLGRRCDGMGEMLTLGMIKTAFGKRTASWIIVRYMESTGLKAVRFRQGKVVRFSVRTDDFWKWVKHRQGMFPVSRMEPLALGPEPKWVDEARKRQRDCPSQRLGSDWTDADDMLLQSMVRQKTPIREMCRRLKRSEISVRNRASLLFLSISYGKERRRRPWTEEEHTTIAEMLIAGATVYEISQAMDRTEHMVRNKMVEKYGTATVGRVVAILMERSGENGRRSDDARLGHGAGRGRAAG